jgi:hypothetical protein
LLPTPTVAFLVSTKLPMCTPSASTVPGRSRANGPICTAPSLRSRRPGRSARAPRCPAPGARPSAGRTGRCARRRPVRPRLPAPRSTSISTSRPTRTVPRWSKRAGIEQARALGAQARAPGAAGTRAPAGQLPRVIGAFGLQRIGDHHDLGRVVLVRGHGEHVGQVVLALRVVVATAAPASASARSESAAMMPVLTRRIRRCSSLASFCSTIAATRPSGSSRTMRP